MTPRKACLTFSRNYRRNGKPRSNRSRRRTPSDCITICGLPYLSLIPLREAQDRLEGNVAKMSGLPGQPTSGPSREGNVAKGNARQESVLRFGAGSTFSCANCDAYRSNLRKDRNRNNFRNIFQHPVTRFARQPGGGYVLNNLLKLRLGQLKCACPSRTASALSPLLIISTNFLCSS